MRGGSGEQSQKELMRFFALAAGGLKETAQYAVVLQALLGASALNDFSHNDQRTQAALGLVVGVTDFFLSVLSAKLVWQGFWRTDRAPVVNLGRIATLWSYAYDGSGRLRSAGFGFGYLAVLAS